MTLLEKQLIGFVDSLADILYCLRTYLLPVFNTFSQLGNMFHKFVHIQVLAKHFVVSLMQSNTMVVDAATGVYLPMDAPIMLGAI